MPEPGNHRPVPSTDLDLTGLLLVSTVLGGAAVTGLLWAAGVAAAAVTGHRVPALAHGGFLSGLRTLAHPADPSRGWHTPMPGPVPYWTVTTAIALILASLAAVIIRWCRAATRSTALDRTPGLAERRDIRTAASVKALRRRAAILRPALDHPTARDLGYRLGTARGIPVWTSVEDSVLIVGPPRSGKGRHLVIPMLNAAPGPVVTTSTRPDNIGATLPARLQAGPVAVFDPQRLAPQLAHGARWSLVRGCTDPQTAMIRASALAAGANDQVENRGFWQAQTETALRAFLHAAALDQLGAADLYRWSLDPAAAHHAVQVLTSNSAAAPGWGDALDAILAGDTRTRDNSWAGIRTALAPLADPRVLAAVTPNLDEQLDPEHFLNSNGTLYLLGTASGAVATARLVAALLEDVIDTARRRAALAAHTRLDPPLALILDEAANYALPSLPALISEGGGTGITTFAVLQSLAQARARWGEHDGAAIWDTASAKIILGGSANARDLHDLVAVIGDRDDTTDSINRDRDGRRSTTASTRRLPILDARTLRTLPYGTGVALLRAAPPILLRLAR